MERDDLGELIVLTASDVDARPWQPLRGNPGVSQKLLWQSGAVRLGMMRIEPGAENPVHTHDSAQHHILVTQGEATILGKRTSAGAYIFVPPGTAHGVSQVGPDGVTFFFTYRPVTGEEPDEQQQRGRHPAVADAEAAVAF